MLKSWKLTLWKVSSVNDTLGHIFLPSFFRQKIFEAWILRLVSRDPNLVNASNNINVFILVLHIHLRASFTLANTAYFIWSLWTSQRTLLASFSSTFLFRDIKSGRGNSSSNNWLSVRLRQTILFKQDDAFFRHASKLNSKNVTNSYYMVDL